MGDSKTILGFEISRNIEIERVDNIIKMLIKYPNKNMQTDDACFESIVLIAKSKGTLDKVIIDFIPVNWTGDFINLCTEQTHYMRFLYRLWKFAEAYDWVSIAEDKNEIVKTFKKNILDLLSNNKIKCNYPKKDAEFNYTKGEEHVLENIFVKDQKCIQECLKKENEVELIENSINNQWPNGLFKTKIEEVNRIFPTGFFDLWAINKNDELCIFELKRDRDLDNADDNGNEKMGVISELFFYANYAYDFLLKPKVLPAIRSNYRGSQDMKNLIYNGKAKKVNAYFLLSKSRHTEIKNKEDKILDLLNSFGKDNIYFQFLTYDINELAETRKFLLKK